MDAPVYPENIGSHLKQLDLVSSGRRYRSRREVWAVNLIGKLL